MSKRIVGSILAAAGMVWAGAVSLRAEDAKPAPAGDAKSAPSDFKINGDPAKGEVTYKTLCLPCHGEKGMGDGVAAAALNPKPRNFTDKALMATISDKQMFTVIKEGGASVGKSPLMVAWGPVLGDDQKIHDVASYVRLFAK